jgi:hypothetical protein
MQSQILWGILLLAAGLLLTFLSLSILPVVLLFYAVPLILIGAALIFFRGRETVIEEAAD